MAAPESARTLSRLILKSKSLVIRCAANTQISIHDQVLTHRCPCFHRYVNARHKHGVICFDIDLSNNHKSEVTSFVRWLYEDTIKFPQRDTINSLVELYAIGVQLSYVRLINMVMDELQDTMARSASVKASFDSKTIGRIFGGGFYGSSCRFRDGGKESILDFCAAIIQYRLAESMSWTAQEVSRLFAHAPEAAEHYMGWQQRAPLRYMPNCNPVLRLDDADEDMEGILTPEFFHHYDENGYH